MKALSIGALEALHRGLQPPIGRGFVQTYINTYAHFSIFPIDMGALLEGLHKASIERGFAKTL